MTRSTAMRAVLLATAALTIFASGCSTANRVVNAPSLHAAPRVAAASRPASTSATAATLSQRKIVSLADYKYVFDDIPSLKRHSTLIVRGRVVATSYFDFNTMTNTRVTLEVLNSNDPKVSVGSTITVIEAGGMTTEANVVRYNNNKYNVTITPQMERTPVEMSFEYAPLTKVGDEAVYFLDDSEQMNGVPGHHYITVGELQGKFRIKDGVAERFAEHNAGGGMKALRMTTDSLEKQAIAKP